MTGTRFSSRIGLLVAILISAFLAYWSLEQSMAIVSLVQPVPKDPTYEKLVVHGNLLFFLFMIFSFLSLFLGWKLLKRVGK